MSLLSDVIKEATAGDDVAKLLRKCMVLAHVLHSTELAAWAKAELNGYSSDAELPTYRRLSCRAMGQMIGPYNSWQGTMEIPFSVLPKEMRANFSSVEAREPIAQFVSLVAKSNEESRLQQPWPTEVARHFAPTAFVTGTQCLKAWNEISPSEVTAMLDQVKSRVLEFALAISTDFPELGKSDELLAESSRRDALVNQTFNTTIMGSVGNIASGSTNVNQVADVMVAQGDIEGLRKALASLGVTSEQIAALESAIEDDRASGQPGIGPRVKAWFGEMTAVALAGAGAIGVNAVGSAIAPVVARFLGIG
jgi:hypothetical protein